MPHRKAAGLATVATSLALIVPGVAQADSGPHVLGKRQRHGLPARVVKPLNRVERSLIRAEDYIDDGDNTKAATALSSVKGNLGRALKATDKRVSGANANGPRSAGALANVADDVIETASDDFDGVTDGDLVEALSSALGAGVADRDTLVATIGKLSSDDQADYRRVASRIADDASNEADDVAESLSDDTLTSAATSALNDAATALAAAQTAASALAGDDSSDTSDRSDSSGSSDSGSGCPHGRGHGGSGGPQGQGPSGDDTGSGDTGSGDTGSQS